MTLLKLTNKLRDIASELWLWQCVYVTNLADYWCIPVYHQNAVSGIDWSYFHFSPLNKDKIQWFAIYLCDFIRNHLSSFNVDDLQQYLSRIKQYLFFTNANYLHVSQHTSKKKVQESILNLWFLWESVETLFNYMIA